MRYVIIVSGGSVDTDLLKREVGKAGDDAFLIACDGGMNALYKTGLAPRLLIGDFDSANEEALAFYDSRFVFSCRKAITKLMPAAIASAVSSV